MPSKFTPKGKKRRAPPIKLVKYWSYSTWSMADECLAKYQFGVLQKALYPQPTNAAMERGGKIHTQGEDFIDTPRARVPTAYRLFAEELKAVKRLGGVAEPNYAFTSRWGLTSPTDWANCWLRVKIDLELITPDSGDVIDYKTGKPYEKKHSVQREIYGVAVYVKHGVPEVSAEHWYLDSGEVATTQFDEQTLKELKKKWTAEGKQLLARKKFPAQPDVFTCKYCPFRSDKKLANGFAGPCDAWKKAK